MLENRLNATLARLRVIEEVLHGEHLWCLRFAGLGNGLILPAKVQIFESGVRFMVRIPTDVPHFMVELLMDNEVVQTTGDVAAHGACVFIWELMVESPLAVA